MIDETKTYGNNGFRKREMVITTEEQYPQHIMIEFVQDKTDLLNNYNVGQDVKVSINVRGRELKTFRKYHRVAICPQCHPQKPLSLQMILTKKNTTIFPFKERQEFYP